jgi:hypothetical protein
MLNDEETGDSFLSANEAVSNNEALPIASQVEPPKELLDRVRELEGKHQNLPNAVLLDEEEVNKRRKLQRCRRWIFVGACVLAVLCVVVGLVLGMTLGRDKAEAPTSPTPSPTSQEFALLKSLIESVSFDGGAALEDSSSPQSKALAWLETNENLDEYPDWRRIQRYVLAVFYYSTGGDEWNWNTGWLSDDDECTWEAWRYNNLCNTNGRFLELLVVDSNNLNGSIPMEVGLLSDTLCKLGDRRELKSSSCVAEVTDIFVPRCFAHATY